MKIVNFMGFSFISIYIITEDRFNEFYSNQKLQFERVMCNLNRSTALVTLFMLTEAINF